MDREKFCQKYFGIGVIIIIHMVCWWQSNYNIVLLKVILLPIWQLHWSELLDKLLLRRVFSKKMLVWGEEAYLWMNKGEDFFSTWFDICNEWWECAQMRRQPTTPNTTKSRKTHRINFPSSWQNSSWHKGICIYHIQVFFEEFFLSGGCFRRAVMFVV